MATVIPGITHTVFVNNLGVTDPSCVGIVDVPGLSLLNLRTMDPISQVRTLDGRTSGTQLNLIDYTFFDYQMRRKAETLQYKKNQFNGAVSKKQQYSSLSKTTSGSYNYSNNEIKKKINCPKINLDIVVRPPTNSGIKDHKYPGYYYDSTVPYFPNL